MGAIELETSRLRLRQWCEPDLAPFAQMNADRAVMQHMPALLTCDESAALLRRNSATLASQGFGLWAVTVKQEAPFIGYVGLSVPSFTAPFTPCVEVGWRLARRHWGHGFATEGARASLHHAFTRLGLDEVVSFTAPANVRSLQVMERLGMVRDSQGDFDHPRLPPGHPLRRHVLYRITHRTWQAQEQAQQNEDHGQQREPPQWERPRRD